MSVQELQVNLEIGGITLYRGVMNIRTDGEAPKAPTYDALLKQVREANRVKAEKIADFLKLKKAYDDLNSHRLKATAAVEDKLSAVSNELATEKAKNKTLLEDCQELEQRLTAELARTEKLKEALSLFRVYKDNFRDPRRTGGTNTAGRKVSRGQSNCITAK